MQRPTASGQPDPIREIYEEANSALVAGDAKAAGLLIQDKIQPETGPFRAPSFYALLVLAPRLHGNIPIRVDRHV
jgi:hypothetical protein